MSDIIISPERIIHVDGGDVYHGMKRTDLGFDGFGEAYFSQVNFNSVKAWKRHKEMTLNLVVPVGKIKFVLFDNRNVETSSFQEVILSKDNYCRLTVPPMVWMGFKGLSKNGSMLLNIANILHDPNEVDSKNIDEINFNWRD